MSIRLRLAVVFTAAAAILFALGSWLFVAELSASLLGTIDAQLAASSAGPAAMSRPARRAPVRLAGAGSPAPGEYVVQVIDPAGRVRGGSPDAGRRRCSARPRSARRGRTARCHQASRGRAGAADGRAADRPSRLGRGGRRLARVLDGTISDVIRNLLIAGAVFVAAAGLVAYGLARAALSPVERLRREVAALSERDAERLASGARAPGTRSPRWPRR